MKEKYTLIGRINTSEGPTWTTGSVDEKGLYFFEKAIQEVFGNKNSFNQGVNNSNIFLADIHYNTKIQELIGEGHRLCIINQSYSPKSNCF
ncbi:MAG: hypothetical protein ACOC1K_00290 [Nanoarchaeota archaeon]